MITAQIAQYYGQRLCFSIYIHYICSSLFDIFQQTGCLFISLLIHFIPPRCEMRRVFSIFAPINLIRNMEQVNHPQHYTTYDVETLDMMIRIWGIKETISFCKLNAFKYRMRAGHKDNAQQDIDKALWYENKMKELSACIPE